MSLRFILVIILGFFLFRQAIAQTSIVGSDGIRYELQKEELPKSVSIKEGEYKIIKASSCVTEKKTFLYITKKCTTERKVTASQGKLIESGGEELLKENTRPEIVITLVGIFFMALAMVALSLKMVAFAFVVVAAAAAVAAFAFAVAAAAFAAAVAAFAVAAFAAAAAESKDKKTFYFFATVYELLMIFVLILVV